MTRYSIVPVQHQVFNEFDRHGIALGLPRLEEERNSDYKRRLLDVMVHRANSTYMGLIYGITRELGLTIDKTIQITMTVDVNGLPILPCPAVIFQDTKCTLYSDYPNSTVVGQFDRWEISGGAFTLSELVASINEIDYFSATLLSGIDGSTRAMQCFNQSSVGFVTSEDIAIGGPRVQLANQHLIEGTISVSSSTLVRRVQNEVDIRQEGDYYIDPVYGILLCSTVPNPGSTIRYQYALHDMTVQSSPVIIHDLQSADFQSKMFQSASPDSSGLPTALGAGIINELLSVYPTTWGK